MACACGFSRSGIDEFLLLLLIRFSAKNGRIGGMLYASTGQSCFQFEVWIALTIAGVVLSLALACGCEKSAFSSAEE